MRPTGSPEALEQRRFRAISLLKDGLQPVDVARRLNVDRRSVRRWKAAFLKEGLEAIRAKPTPGRPEKLSEQEKKDLEEKLLRGAQAAGFANDLWTHPRVARLIFNSYGVRYHVDHIGRLLRSLNGILQNPQKRSIPLDRKQTQRLIK